MIKVEHIETWGFEHAIRGMRNPMNSWEKSDSGWKVMNPIAVGFGYDANYEYIIGENDLDLMKRLYNGGTEHRKYMRQIFVSMDITAPLYWWKEFDTYKVGTCANSCSTMHKIHDKEFTLDDFSHEHLDQYSLDVLSRVITALNIARDDYLEDNESRYEALGVTRKYDWWQMIQLLPSSYNQRRTVTFTYENVVSMLHQRENHKLDEWRELCKCFKQLPYIEEITG